MKKQVLFAIISLAVLWVLGSLILSPKQGLAIVEDPAVIQDGDLIRSPNVEGMNKFDIYIVRLISQKKFKRLILSPHVFESYGHFDKNNNGTPWDDVIDVSQVIINQFVISDLVRSVDDNKVYRLSTVTGSDTGQITWVNMDATAFNYQGYDSDSIYEINVQDRNAYSSGASPKDSGPDLSQGLGGGQTWISTYCKAFDEELTPISSLNWESFENSNYNYSFQYPIESYNYHYGNIGPNKANNDVAIQDEVILVSKSNTIPSWWSSEKNNTVCPYQQPTVYVKTYLNLANKSLNALAQELSFCRTDPNYTIDGVSAIRCRKKCNHYFDSGQDISWIDNQAKEWLNTQFVEQGRYIQCTEDITDEILFINNGYRYIIKTTSFIDDGLQRQTIEEMLKTFSFGNLSTEKVDIQLYFNKQYIVESKYSEYDAVEKDCISNNPITRTISKPNSTPLKALDLLIAGPYLNENTDTETYTSPIIGTFVKSFSIANKIASVNFDQSLFSLRKYLKNWPGSCIGTEKLTAIRNTLRQFDEIDDIRLFIEGEEIDISSFDVFLRTEDIDLQSSEKVNITIYHNNDNINCLADNPVTYIVTKPDSMPLKALDLLILNTNEDANYVEEQGKGYPLKDTHLQDYYTQNKVAFVDLDKSLFENTTNYLEIPGSCIGRGVVTAVRNTLLQFNEINEIRLFLEGKEIDISSFID